MEVFRDDETGVWLLRPSDEERGLKPDYLRAFPQFATAFDSLARRAKEQYEADFILSLIGIRGAQAAGWDPYETTTKGIPAVTRVHNETDDRLAARHLQLWIYGHMVEAAAPYDLLANLARMAVGERARMTWFPADDGPPVSPGRKIAAVARWADEAGNQAVGHLLPEIWDRELRNAVFHSDYSIHAGEVRLIATGGVRSLEELARLSGTADAYHDAVIGVRRAHLQSYSEPKRIPGGPIVADPQADLMVIVREGEGAVGLKDALTPEERAAGGIRFRYAKLYPDEVALLEADPQLARLPARADHERQEPPAAEPAN